MFGGKPDLKEGQYVFAAVGNEEYRNFVIGSVTGVDGKRVGINGILVNPVGLKNKVAQKKAVSIIYRVEYEDTVLRCWVC